jgi:hypothetical protein
MAIIGIEHGARNQAIGAMEWKQGLPDLFQATLNGHRINEIVYSRNRHRRGSRQSSIKRRSLNFSERKSS